jgi:hypothetical protein
MRLGDGVDFDRHDTGALGGVSRDASLSGGGVGDGLFHWLGLFLFDESKVKVIDEETDAM